MRLRFAAEVAPQVPIEGFAADREVTFLALESIWPDERYDSSKTRRLADVANGYTRFLENDVLVPKITPTFEAARSAMATGIRGGGPGFGTTEVHVIRPGPALDPRFLWYRTLAQDFVSIGASEMVGVAGQKRVPTEFVKNFEIQVPSRCEQERIADFLDEETQRIARIANLKRRLHELLAERLARVAEMIVQQARGTPRRLRFVCRIQQGWSPQAGSAESTNGEVGMLKLSAISSGRFRAHENRVIAEELLDSAPWRQWLLRPGDVLLARASGSAHLVGSVCQVEGIGSRQLIFPDLMYRLEPMTDRLDRRFLAIALQAPSIRSSLLSKIRGAANNKVRIEDVMDTAIPLPDPDEQSQACAAYSEFRTVVERLWGAIDHDIRLLSERRRALITAAVTEQLDPASYCEPEVAA